MNKKIFIIGLCMIIILSGLVSGALTQRTITIQNETTGNLADTYIYDSSADTNFGDFTDLDLLNSSGGLNKNFLIKFNLSNLPIGSTIQESTLYLYLFDNELDDATERYNAKAHHLFNQTWIETYPTWNNISDLGSFNNTFESNFSFFGGAGEPIGWIPWNVTLMTRKEFNNNNNLSIRMLVELQAGAPANTDNLEFYSRNYNTNPNLRPLLNVTVLFNNTPEVTGNTNPSNPLPTQNINFNITCNDTDDNTMIGFLQIYDNGIAFGSEISQTVINNTNTLLTSVGSDNTSGGDNWTGEYWCGDEFTNSTKINDSVIVVDTTFINITQIRDTLGNILTGEFNITNLNNNFTIEGSTPLIINATTGNNVLTINKTGYFEINHTITGIQDQTTTISSLTMYDSKFEVFVVNSEDNSSIERFNITIISNDNTSFTQTYNNRNTSMNFNLTSGSYNFTTRANGRGTSFTTLNVSSGISNTTIIMFPRNTINFTIIDLTNLSILDHQLVTIELVGLTRTYNLSTTNGNAFISDINDDTYIVTAISSGFDNTNIILTTSDSSPQEVTLYMDKGKTSKLFYTIDGSTNRQVPDTILTFTRNINGTFVTTTQVITDFTGAAIVLLNENITYTFTAINPNYNVFTGDVNPATSSTFTVDLTLLGGLAYESFLNFLLYNTIVINNGSQLNISLSTFAQTTPGIVEWFSINATYNGTSYFTNVSGSPGGGTAKITVPGINTDQADTVSIIYGIKANSYPSWKWNEISLIILLNATNTTIMTGLFDISDDDITINGRAILGMFFIVLVLGGLTAASRSITIGALGGIVTLGVMVMPQVALLPLQYGAVSLVVLVVLVISERVTGGAT